MSDNEHPQKQPAQPGCAPVTCSAYMTPMHPEKCRYENPSEPCWGPVELVDEDYDEETGEYSWVHACSGHCGCWDGEPYVRNAAGELPIGPAPEETAAN